MGDRIIKKKYGRIEFTLASPLALSSGMNRYTDRDLMKDALGRPYIPASAVAGVTRDILTEEIGEKDLREYFGYIEKNRGKAREDEDAVRQEGSTLIFYDAELAEGSQTNISVRDSVALDQYKTARKGAKFDMEVLETGARFVLYLEQDFIEEKSEDFIQKIAELFLAGKVSFGGKTMRGYGEISAVHAYEREFSFTCSEDRKEWLKFDLYSKENGKWKAITAGPSVNKKELVLHLKQNGGISIRRYTTRVGKDENEVVPDYEQMTAHGMESVEPVIPGTSWAGAFRHRMSEFGIPVSGENTIFGFVDKEKKKKERSKIRFSESRIHNAKEKILSRNAIDRFTGGTVNGALFTEKTYYCGNTELSIGWKSKEKMGEKEKEALAAAITDLHFGYLAVGGETAIGRGLFTIEKITGGDSEIEIATKDEKDIYTTVLDVVKGVF